MWLPNCKPAFHSRSVGGSGGKCKLNVGRSFGSLVASFQEGAPKRTSLKSAHEGRENWNLGNIISGVSSLNSCESLHVLNIAFLFQLLKVNQMHQLKCIP